MHLRLTLLVLALISLLTVGVGGFFVASQLSDTSWRIARDHTSKTADVIKREIDFFLQRSQKASSALAHVPLLQTAFEPVSHHKLLKVNTFLKDYCRTHLASICYVLDKDGTAIASSNFESPSSLIGKNYSF